MSERWVLNASPLISLARIGCADWFARLADEVVVPEAVRAEIDAGPLDAARQFLAEGLLPVVVTPQPPPEIAVWDLGAGENAVLSLVASERERTAVLDDLPARRCANSLGLLVRGTLGVVVLARQAGLASSATDVLVALRAGGFRLDDAVIRHVLRVAVGEEWPGQ